jgi:hypothetical protein
MRSSSHSRFAERCLLCQAVRQRARQSHRLPVRPPVGLHERWQAATVGCMIPSTLAVIVTGPSDAFVVLITGHYE